MINQTYTVVSGAITRVKWLTVIGLITLVLGALIPQTDLFSPKAISFMTVIYIVVRTIRDYFDPTIPNT